MSDPQTEVPALPDLVLVEVLRHVDGWTLLACRLTCRRLLDLVGAPRVWSHRSVSWRDWLRFALRLAPCVRELLLRHELGIRSSPPYDLASTGCAAEVLALSWHKYCNEALIVPAVRRQVELGRLKELIIFIDAKVDSLAAFDELESTIVSTSGSLRNLHIDIRPSYSGLCSSSLPNIAPSLKRFACTMEASDDPLWKRLLTAHAPTLQHVNLVPSGLSPNDLMAWPRLKFPLLAELICPVMDGMGGLLHCEALDTLRLIVDWWDPMPPELADVLRKNTSIRDLRISYQGSFRENTDWLNLTQFLAQSSVTRLTIDQEQGPFPYSFGGDPVHSGVYFSETPLFLSPQIFMSLAATLPTLPSLEELRVDLYQAAAADIQELLRVVRPITTPRLRHLDLTHTSLIVLLRPLIGPPDCKLCWSRSSNVQEMMSSNPSLRFSLFGHENDWDTYLNTHCSFCDSEYGCKWCSTCNSSC